jgi:hypothetical protein
MKGVMGEIQLRPSPAQGWKCFRQWIHMPPSAPWFLPTTGHALRALHREFVDRDIRR